MAVHVQEFADTLCMPQYSVTAVDFHPGQNWKDTDGDTIQVCMHQTLFAS